MVSLLSRFVLTPEPCKFLHNFRGKGLEPCYASLVNKKSHSNADVVTDTGKNL